MIRSIITASCMHGSENALLAFERESFSLLQYNPGSGTLG